MPRGPQAPRSKGPRPAQGPRPHKPHHPKRGAPRPAPAPRPERDGLPARRLAHWLIAGVLIHHRPLNQLLADHAARPDAPALPPRDRALARLIAATVLRRQGELDHILKAFLAKPLPIDNTGNLRPILLAGAAQLVALGTPPHAVVDLAVAAVRRDRAAHRFSGLVNAVLRRVGERGAALLAGQDATRLNIPDWLWQRWREAYGEDTARAIAVASLAEAPLDLTLKPGADADAWAATLNAQRLPTGSLRLASAARIEDLPGYADGAWWVQDAAAALVARLAGDLTGRTVADLCAAPGGKTAQLTAAGAHVTAVDVSEARLARVRENLARLHLTADIVAADATTWSPGRTFDAVVLDAPCSATGTLRRHPDILRLRRPEDITRMASLQTSLLANAASLVRPGGTLVYATCSLEREEGEAQVDTFLAAHPDFARAPIDAAALGLDPVAVTPAGDLRTLPSHAFAPAASASSAGAPSGMDGFFATRLHRRA